MAARRTTRLNPDGWIGEQISVGANNERFFSGYRIEGDTFHVGDAVLVKLESYGQTQVMKIDAFFEDANGVKCFEGRWYYPPEDTSCGRLVGHDPREVFETVHVDEHQVDCIDGHCTVMEWDAYQQWLDAGAVDDDDNHEDETTFVCRAAYHPGSGEFVPLTGASSLAEAVRVGGRQQQQQQPAQAAAAAAQQQASAKQRGKRPAGRGAEPAAANPWSLALDEADDAVGAATAAVASRKKRRLGRFAEAAARLAPSAAPERMPCREKERDEVIGVLRSAILEGALGGSLYLSGTPGTGKTATVHQALRALTAEKLPPFRTIFVNGMKLSSPYEVYSLLWEQLTGQAVKSARALELLERRFSTPAAGGKAAVGGKGGVGGGKVGAAPGVKRRAAGEKVIVILDELDYLVTGKQSVIYNLFEWATRGKTPVSIRTLHVAAQARVLVLAACLCLLRACACCVLVLAACLLAMPLLPHLLMPRELIPAVQTGSSHMLVVGISNTMDLPERLLPRVESDAPGDRTAAHLLTCARVARC